MTVSEFALRFATDEMERAERDLENKHLAWLIAREARPTEIALDEMEALCDAVHYWRNAEAALHRAKLDVQAEWATRWRHGNSSTGADFGPCEAETQQGGQTELAPVGELPCRHAVDPRVMRFPGFISSRED